jgi:hypothetical protein
MENDQGKPTVSSPTCAALLCDVPKELLDQVISELNKAKLMMFGGMYTVQDLTLPTSVKRKLVEQSFKVNHLAGELFAHTLKDEHTEDEIKESKELNERALKKALRYFDRKHKDT